MAFTARDELKIKFDIVKAFGDTAKSYIQISSAALALPILFTQAILGKNAAENGLRSGGGVPFALYAAWAAFLFAIGFGLIYRWSSIRRLWDELHTMQRTEGNVSKPGFRRTRWVIHFDKWNLSFFYGGMVISFFIGILSFALFASTLLSGRPAVKVVSAALENQAPPQKPPQNEDKPIAVKVAPVDVKKDRADYIYIGASLLLTFVTLVIAGIAWKQASSAQLSAQAVINAERPWLLIPLGEQFSEIEEPHLVARLPGEYRRSYATLRMKNFGRSPAKVTETKWGLFTGTNIEAVPDIRVYDSQNALSEDYTVPQNTIIPLQATFETDGRLTPEEVEEVMAKKTRFVWLCGYCKYVDTFERKNAPIYETRFCYRWVNNTDSPKPFWILAGPREYNRAT